MRIISKGENLGENKMNSNTHIGFIRFVIAVIAAFLLYAPNLPASEPTVLRVGPIGLTVSDLDRWFQHIAIVVSDMDKAYDRLHRIKVKAISTEPQQIPKWNKAAAGIRAFYFRDPDNHPLELIYFPPGKADGRWQEKDADLFMGNDHTAIAV